MAIIRWNPASDLINLHSELDRLFGDLSEGMVATRGQGTMGSMPVFLPVDIERDDKALTIRASVPGFKPEEVSITIDDNMLTIDARHEEEREVKDGDGKNMLRRERYTGRLYRQIMLGEGIDAENVQARFENGELVITVPVVRKPQPRRIQVQAAQSKSNGGGQRKVGEGERSRAAELAGTPQGEGATARTAGAG
jgi:HSP20 family protein